MFEKAIAKISKSIFPVFTFIPQGNNKFGVNVAGTGFFVNDRGDFVTVAHLYDNLPNNTKHVFIGHLPDHVHGRLEITEIARDDEHDILIGHVDMPKSEYIQLERGLVNVGRSVCISGYPLASISQNANGGLELSGVRRYFQPSFVLDTATVKSQSGAKLRDHKGFVIRDIGLFGMSGGAVFTPDARVVGMQGSVTAPRTSSNGTRSITVENAVAINSHLILDVLKANNVPVGKTKLKVSIGQILELLVPRQRVKAS